MSQTRKSNGGGGMPVGEAEAGRKETKVPPAAVSNMESPAKAPEYGSLMEELQAIDFVLIELNLYLDTHPADYEAIKQYNQYAQRRAELARQYELTQGPLHHFGESYSKYPWQWNDSPWPWEM